MSKTLEAVTRNSSDNSALLDSIEIADLKLPNRVFMAPLTRARSKEDGHLQTPLHALYYAQRAGAGLIISEATQISQQGQGYAWTPGIYTSEQAESWKLVTDAIHNEGGHIFCQLWHVGAISHPIFQKDGAKPVSSSAWTPKGQAFVGSLHQDGPMVDHEEAQALSREQIAEIIDDYRNAARFAKEAGFDGVELHAANGYLIDQFLRDSVNKRDDEYAGSVENRLRFMIEALEALCEVLPVGRIGVRLSPTGGPGGSYDSDPHRVYTAAAKALAGRGLAYLHVIRPNTHTGDGNCDEKSLQLVQDMRDAFDSTFVINGEFEPEEAAQWVKDGKADAVAFGRLFIANPDLPVRIANEGPYNTPDQDSFYGGGAQGYTDYPKVQKTNDTL